MSELKKKLFYEVLSGPEELIKTSLLLKGAPFTSLLTTKISKKCSIDARCVFMLIVYLPFTSANLTNPSDLKYLLDFWILSYMLLKQSEGCKQYEMKMIEKQILKHFELRNISETTKELWQAHKVAIESRITGNAMGDAKHNHGVPIYYTPLVDLNILPAGVCNKCQDAIAKMWDASNEIASADGEKIVGESVKRDCPIDYETLKYEVIAASKTILNCDEPIEFKQYAFSVIFIQFALSKYTLDYYLHARFKQSKGDDGLDYF